MCHKVTGTPASAFDLDLEINCVIRETGLQNAFVLHLQKFAFSSRFLSPEFIPPRGRIDPLKLFLERKDMIQRRKVFNIPEFYVGQ